MPKRIANHTLRIQRDGETVTPPIGKPFDFTDAEIKTFLSLNPESLSKVIAPDDAAGPDTGEVTFTQAQLDAKVLEATSADRAALEAEIRKQIEAENAAKEVKPAAKNAGGKPADTKKGEDVAKDDDI